MKARRIGPGVYAVGPLGEIEMEQWVIDDRVAHGLSAPASARHLSHRLTSVPADRLGAPPQTESVNTAAAEHIR